MAEPTWKAPKIRDIRNQLTGRNVEADIRSNICVRCHGPANDFKDEVSRKDYAIVGFCQQCQDLIYGSLEDDDE